MERAALDWTVTTLEFDTLWCEVVIGDAELWLEWNPRVFAYRFGFRRGAFVSGSTLGYADSLEEAQGLALIAIQES
ncbi:MAG: hypothetical protein HC933_04770 [Pleurocapsa sp. SU_196_0]|nr:hypothetical protein [Pleurocapsa sp. SU_196_0]